MPEGGRRHGTGAPRGNMNALKHGAHHENCSPGLLCVHCEIPEGPIVPVNGIREKRPGDE